MKEDVFLCLKCAVEPGTVRLNKNIFISQPIQIPNPKPTNQPIHHHQTTDLTTFAIVYVDQLIGQSVQVSREELLVNFGQQSSSSKTDF
jgi:hypothetical protein